MKALVIIPCYNESKSINDVISDVKSATCEGVKLDYLVIDDGSTDNSAAVLQKLNANYLRLVINSGIGTAVQTGYKYARARDYDIAIQFDGDGQHDANSINDLITPILKGQADFVIGSRFVEKHGKNYKSSFARRIGIVILSKLVKLFSGCTIKDVTSGFRAANRKIINIFADDYPSEYPEPVTDLTIARLGYKIKEVPAKMKKRQFGKSSITPIKSAYYMINVAILFLINVIVIRRKK